MKAILKYNVLKQDDNKTVETVWKQKFGISAGLFTVLKLSGKLRKNGEICRSIDTVADGDVLTADVTEEEASENIVSSDIRFGIVYEDEFLLVTDKPRGVSVHPSIGNFDNTLANGVMYHWSKNGEKHKFHAVNRIDKDTSGICVVAKNRFAHGILSEQIKRGSFKRRYYAAVKGILPEKSGVIDKPIKRAEESVIKRIVSDDGKNAVTHYHVVNETDGVSLIDVWLETGRTHQIRVHFSDMGYPLVGDWLYGEVAENEKEGHLLHAYSVEFNHPVTGEKLSFCLDLPDDMKMYKKK